jgi:hypothetical protein
VVLPQASEPSKVMNKPGIMVEMGIFF